MPRCRSPTPRSPSHGRRKTPGSIGHEAADQPSSSVAAHYSPAASLALTAPFLLIILVLAFVLADPGSAAREPVRAGARPWRTMPASSNNPPISASCSAPCGSPAKSRCWPCCSAIRWPGSWPTDTGVARWPFCWPPCCCRSGPRCWFAPMLGSCSCSATVWSTRSSLGLHLTDKPIGLLYTEGTVVMAMAHVLLPFMILPLYASLRAIPAEYSRAAQVLGASDAAAFREIVLPLVAAWGGFRLFDGVPAVARLLRHSQRWSAGRSRRCWPPWCSSRSPSC